MNAYEIVTDRWSVCVMVDKDIQSEKIEALAGVCHQQMISNGNDGIHQEGFVSYLNKKFGAGTAQPTPYSKASDHLIFI